MNNETRTKPMLCGLFPAQWVTVMRFNDIENFNSVNDAFNSLTNYLTNRQQDFSKMPVSHAEDITEDELNGIANMFAMFANEFSYMKPTTNVPQKSTIMKSGTG